MALFSHNRNQIDQVPAEVQEYYQAERRERTGMAWLLALATLAGTVALAAALFYGGKWVYRTVANRDNKPAAPQAGNQGAGGNQNQNPGQDGSAGAPTGTSSTNTETPSPTPPPGSGNAPAQQGGGSPAGTSGPGAGGAAAGSGSALVNTGPDNIVTSFVLVSTGGAVVHYMFAMRRARS